MKEPLEDFFRKKLSSDVDEGWNMPADDIWEKALPHFKEEKTKRKFGFWIWLLGAVLLLIVLSVGYSGRLLSEHKSLIVTKQELPVKESTISPAHQRIISKDKKTNITKQNSVQKTDSSRKQKSILNKKSTKIKQTELHQISTTKRNKITLGKTKIDTPFFKNSQKIKLVDKIPYKSDTLRSVNVLRQLPILGRQIDSPNSEIIFSQDVKKVINHSERKWSILASYLPTLSRLIVIPKNDNIKGNKTYQFANNFELEISRALRNNWAVYSGIGVFNINSNTESKKSMLYDKTTEINMPNNQITNSIALRAQSPLGDYRMSAVVSMPASKPIASGDIVDAYITNNQIVRYVYVPLGIRHLKQVCPRFSLFSDVGVAYNYLLNETTQSSGRMMHGVDEMPLKLQKTDRMDQLAQSMISASIGVGALHEITSALSGFYGVNYRRSLHPIFKNTEYETNFSSLQMRLGIKYSF